MKEERHQVEAEKAQARERTAADQKELEQLQSDRKQIIAKLKPLTYSAYERIRKKKNGLAAVEAVEGRCSACQIALRPQFYQDLRKGDQLMLCESCGRILYYNPPVSFEDDLAQPASSAQSAKR